MAVAETIARAVKDGGGLISREDLKGYRAKWRTPVEFAYRGKTVVGMPPPSSGGVTMAMIAHLLATYDLHAQGWHSPGEVHLTAEAMRRAFAARNAKLGDPDFVKNPVDELLSDAWAVKQRATMQPDRATPTQDLFPGAPAATHDGPHTTHFAVVDGEGNAVALTTTLNAWYGSGVTVPGLGFVLNDEMDDFASVPGTANMFGLVQGEPNAIAPGKRMLSSMSPTIVLGADGKVDLVLGAAGGSRIITATFEELSNVVDFGMDAADAVRAPRFHQQDSPDVLMLEPHALPDDVRRALEAMGHTTKEVEHLADAPAISRTLGLWDGAAEPRREGSLALGSENASQKNAGELVPEPVESERWRRRGEEPYSRYSRTATTPDDASAKLSAGYGTSSRRSAARRASALARSGGLASHRSALSSSNAAVS